MIKNYFKIALRNLWKNKTFTILNLSALTVSLAACLIIYLWVTHERNYDQSGANADRVYRVALSLEIGNQPIQKFAITAGPLAPALVRDIPEVENAARLIVGSTLLSYRDRHFFTDKFMQADPSFFEVFGYSLLKGNPKTALADINSVVLSESTAKKYFPNEDPMGKIITMNDTVPLTVSGIMSDLPEATHFKFEAIGSFKKVEALWGSPNWWDVSYYTYLLLRNKESMTTVSRKIAGILDKYNGPQNRAFGFKASISSASYRYSFILQPSG
jgi:putative ABC transport system permease protein